jgi:hypothetical protein
METGWRPGQESSRMQGFAARSERPRWPFDAEDQLRFQRNALWNLAVVHRIKIIVAASSGG